MWGPAQAPLLRITTPLCGFGFSFLGFQIAHLISLCPGTAPKPTVLTASGTRRGERRQESEFLGTEGSIPLTGVQPWGSCQSVVDISHDLSHTASNHCRNRRQGHACPDIYVIPFLLSHSLVLLNPLKSFYSSRTMEGPSFMEIEFTYNKTHTLNARSDQF